MHPDELLELLQNLSTLGGEPSDIEAKRATGGLPQSLRQTLCAFSNTEGGLILLGVDKAQGFAPVNLPNPTVIRDSLMQMSRDDFTPPLRITANIIRMEDNHLIVAQVPQVTPDLLPVYITARGVVGGSYLRSGDGDRLLTQAEIALLIGGRTQPLYDRESVAGTDPSDLNQDSLRRTFSRIRINSPRLGLATDAELLFRLGITDSAADDACLTLAGLLAYGEYPQQWFPQLMVTFVHHPSAHIAAHGTRFLDNVTARGSIPEQVQTCMAAIRRNLAMRATMSNQGSRVDRSEYPLEAVREALVNALLHRDYSPTSRGSQVQVDLFPDRFIIRSPGGVYGGISPEQLGEEPVSSSRNSVLASLLSDTYLPASQELVAENRASGISAMISATRAYGLPQPVFQSSITTFTVELDRRALFSADTLQFIARLNLGAVSHEHKTAVALAHHGSISPARLRQAGVDRHIVPNVLRDLLAAGVIVPEKARHYPRYTLSPEHRAELTQ
ncbi:MAG: ATP-binding protein, partial [Angustibacter sp.]